MNTPAIPKELFAALSEKSQTVDERILIEQTNSLLNTGLSAGLGALLAAAGFWLVFYYQTRQPAVLVWAVVMHILQGVRFVSSLHFIRTPYAQRNPIPAANRYCNLLVLTGTTWGLAPWIFLPPENLPLTSLMMLVLLGMSSGGIASLAPYRRGIFSFTIPVLLGLASALLWQGGGVNLFLAVCTLAYLYVNLSFGLQQNKLLTEALRTRYEKEDLAQRLSEQAQRLVEQVRIAEHANLEKTRFLASASHDLRQPLHSIGLFGAALLVKCKSTPNEPLVLNLMLCVDALEASFTAMLDVSKLDAGVVEVKSQPVALVHLFRRLETSFGRQAEALGLALRFKPGGKCIYGDPILMERLLGNLVHNALKFTQLGGVVLVARTRENHVSVEIWDSGTGIDANEIPRIFDEFYQLNNPERERSKGLGMGLSIVQRLANLMDMPLTVYSKVGRGTVFKLLVPLAGPQHEQVLSAPRVSTHPTVNSLSGKRVLIVDDVENVRGSTAAVLSLYGLHVETADGLQQALEIALRPKQYLDAVITDLRLRHGENGIHLVDELNARLGRKLPALLVTGDIAPERVQLAQQSGLRVLYKPVNVDDLLEALRELQM
jgi:signal transduction histidine kinase